MKYVGLHCPLLPNPAGLKCRNVRYRQLLAAISAALKHGPNQIFVLPGETAEKNRDPAALFGCESAFNRTMKVRGLIKSCNLPQACALCRKPLFDFRVILNVNELCRHFFLRRGTVCLIWVLELANAGGVWNRSRSKVLESLSAQQEAVLQKTSDLPTSNIRTPGTLG